MDFFKNHRNILLVACIVLIALVLRFYQLGNNPISLNWDEAAWGYNAYALGIDGRDEFGRFLPYDYIESFGDFKPPLYAYVSILPVKVFGLTEFATRFASAFFGVLTVFVTYFLVRMIFYTSKYREQYALVTAMLLAISPWHIMLSRAAFEANLVTFFLVLGVWLFLKGIRGNGWYIVLSVLPFAASFYTFNTARIVTPLIVLLVCLSFMKILFHKKRKEIVIAGLLGVLLVGPLVPFLLSDQAALRFREVNIFSDISVIERTNQQIANDDNALWSRILHHRYLAFSVEYLKHYLDHFNPDFLFIRGDVNPKFSTQDVGQLYLFEIPFFIAGIILLFRKREGYWWIIPLWLILGIIPAATARETPHALRIESTLPTFQIFSAIGLVWFFILLEKQHRRIRQASLSILAVIIVLNVLYYLHGYYTHYPREYASEWQYGYKEAVAYMNKNSGLFEEIQFTEALGRPYIFYLFHTKTDPMVFREQAVVKRDDFGFVRVESLGSLTFHKHVKPDLGSETKTLYITVPGEVPDGADVLEQFLLPDGRVQLVAYTI